MMAPSLIAANFALLFLIVGSNFVLLPIHSCLICMSTLVVYIGSHRSLVSNSSGDVKMEYMKRKDAYMFPVMAGITLVGLFVVFKYLDKELVNLVITAYISVVSLFVVANELEPLLALFLSNPDPVFEIKHYYKEELNPAPVVPDSSWFFTVFGFSFPTTMPWSRGSAKPKVEYVKKSVDYPIKQSTIAALGVGLVTTVWYVYTKHWVANNLIGVALSLQAIESLSLGSFQNGVYLLILLFFYDIFFVFGTDVMVTVAKNVDAPIKLMFIKQFALLDSDAMFSMLGLGDIVLPGVFVALLLRFDVKTAKNNVFPLAMLCYAMGLWLTVLVMHVFKHAQPALLYLVPAVLFASAAGSWYNQCFKELWEFEEGPPKEDEKTVKTE